MALEAVAQEVPPSQVPTTSGITPPAKVDTKDVPIPPPLALPSPSSLASEPLTADEAAKIALRSQPSIAQAGAQILFARGRVQVVMAGLLPTITISSTYTQGWQHFSGVEGSPLSTGYSNSAIVRQLLFDFGHTRNLVRQASALEKAAQHNLTRAQSDLVFQVKQQYYQFVNDSRLVDVDQADVGNRQAQLALATASLNSGLGPPADVVQAKTLLATSAQQLEQARQTALNSRITLALFMGVDPRTPIVPEATDEPAPVSRDLAALVDQALKTRPELRVARENINAAQFEVSAARTSSAPSLGFDVGASGSQTVSPTSYLGSTFGISVSWPVFDAGVSAGLVKEGKADLLTAQAQLQQFRLNILSDVSQAFVALESAERQIGIAEAAVDNALASVRLSEGRYRAGIATFIEVTTAQAALVQAQSNLVIARQAENQARAQLAHAIGTP